MGVFFLFISLGVLIAHLSRDTNPTLTAKDGNTPANQVAEE